MFDGLPHFVWWELFGAACFALGYWVKGRGLKGIWSDIQDIKMDIEHLKKKPTTVVVTTPNDTIPMAQA